MAKKPTAILVLGMHRSGTSALTRVINLMGMDLPHRLMPPAGGNNETGFWESLEIAEIHDRLLAEIGSSWDDCLGIPEERFDSAAVRGYADEILDTLQADFATSTGFVVKDPRICRFVPFWIDIIQRFGARCYPVLIARNPLEVAASLKNRDHFPAGKSLHLWLRHFLDMERGSRDLQRSLLSYPNLLDDWRGVVEIIGHGLGSPWPRDLEQAAPEIEGFLSKTLRHHHAEEMSPDDHPELYRWAGQTHASYTRAMRGGEDLVATFDRVATGLDAAESVFAPAVTDIQGILREDRRRQHEQAISLQTDIDDLIKTHALAKETYEAEVDKFSRAHRDDKEKYDAVIDKINRATQKDRQGYESEIAKLIETHQQDQRIYESEIAKNRKMLQEFDAKIYEMRDTLEELMAERDRLLALTSDTQSAFEHELSDVQLALEESEVQLRERRQALETSNLERNRLIQERDDLESLRARLARDLERTRLRAAKLDTDRKLAEDTASRLQSHLEDLQESLHDTTRDKDWLWEQWHQTKDELDAPRRSKIGRLIWGQWTLYLAARNRLVGLGNSLKRQSPEQDSAGLESPPQNPVQRLWSLIVLACASLVRLVTRCMGWLFLFVTVLTEQLLGAVRDLFRRTSQARMEISGRGAPARKPRVLLLSPYPIYPANHGGGVRIYNLVQRLSEHCELHLLIFSSTGENPAQRQALAPWTSSVHFHHWQPLYEPGRWGLQPPNVGLFASDQVARQVAHLLASKCIDILQLEYTELGQYGLPRFAGVKVVLTEHDLAYRQHWRRRKMGFHHRYPEGNAYGSSFGDWLRLTRYELAVCRRADQIHVMSHDDGQALSRFMPDAGKRIKVVPNAVDTKFYDPSSNTTERQGILYVGNFQNLPNIDALEYLVADIWPLIRDRSPAAQLTVLGANPSDRVTRLDQLDGIRVVGAVPDLRPYYHSHRLMVAPIRAGSGTRLKILEAFASGLPVVTTTLGAEGIDANSDEHLIRADNAETFATAVTRLLHDDELSDRLSTNGRQLAKDAYDWQRSADATLAGWSELLSKNDKPDSKSSVTLTQDGGTQQEPVAKAATQSHSVDISVIIPTLRGGPVFERCLQAIASQETDRSVEVICVDSGSPESDLAIMRRFDARVVAIKPSEFNHGLTRDLGAANSGGEVLVFLNQDAIPEGPQWLSHLTQPLFEDPSCAAVQGAIHEVADPEERFFWDSCGDRFYFTRESDRWLERYFGIGFSTVNAAIRRSVWQDHPFGQAAIMEDKKWQKKVVDRRHVITTEPQAAVIHTHNYQLRSLWRRCLSEGFGWRLVGERYSLFDMVRDGLQIRVHKDLIRGLSAGRVRSSAELLFPWLRPLALYWGNHWSRSVKL